MATVVVKTIGTGGDYSTLQAWEDASPANLVTADQIWRGEVLNQEFVGTGTMLTMTGSTADVDHYKELTTATGASFTEHADKLTNPLRYDASKGAAIRSSSSYVANVRLNEVFARISNLQIQSTAGNSGQVLYVTLGSAANCVVEGVANRPLHVFSTNSSVSNIVVIKKGAGNRIADVASLAKATNCTFVNVNGVAATGIGGGYGAATLTNCAVFGATTFGSSTAATCVNVFSDGASPPAGVTTVAYDTSTGSGFENITSGTHDFRIKSTSALVNSGTATDAPTTDIVGTTRPQGASFDVGAWEYGAAAPPSGDPTGTLSATETGSDTAVLSGQIVVQGALAASDTGSDTAAFSGKVIVTGTLAAQETGSDTAALNGSASVTLTGTLAATEVGADTATLTGKLLVQGALSATETGSDTALINGSSVIITTGSINATESGGDTAAMTGAVLVQALIDAVEQGADTAQLVGQIVIKGTLAAVEVGSDTAAIYSTEPVLVVAGALTRPSRLQSSGRPRNVQAGVRARR